MRDLLHDKGGLSSSVNIWPDTVEQLSENRVQGLDMSFTFALQSCFTHLLLRSHLLVTCLV
jgi:hypothetical protein